MTYRPHIETERLVLRPWTLSDQDRAFFHHIHSEPQVRRFYVSRFDRTQADAILENHVTRYAGDAPQWLIACDRATGKPLGFTGLAAVAYEPPGPCIETGWQYTPAAWGKGYATEAALALLEHGFRELGLDEIVAFAVHDNRASIAVMERIGMARRGEFDHPKVPADTHPYLRRHVLYAINRGEWQRMQPS